MCSWTSLHWHKWKFHRSIQIKMGCIHGPRCKRSLICLLWVTGTYLLCQWPDPWWGVQWWHRQLQLLPERPWADTAPPLVKGWAPSPGVCTAGTEGRLPTLSKGKRVLRGWSWNRWNYNHSWLQEQVIHVWAFSSLLITRPYSTHEGDISYTKTLRKNYNNKIDLPLIWRLIVQFRKENKRNMKGKMKMKFW